MKFKNALVIIDIQTFFIGAFYRCQLDRLIKNISREINIAKRNKDVIIFVEYNPEHYGPTNATLRQLVKNYPFSIFIEKEFRDGSSEIVDLINTDDRLKNVNKLKVCGVYIEQCVKATVNGLAEKNVKNQIDLLLYSSEFGNFKDSFSNGDINPSVNIIEKTLTPV